MKNFKRKYFQIILLQSVWMTLAISGFSQEEKDPQKMQVIEQRIELIAESIGDEELDLNTVFDALSNFYDNPINLNKTSREELQELLLLTDVQVNALFVHMERNGKLISIYELQAVPGFDKQSIWLILPFVKVADNFDSPKITFKTLFKEGQHELFMRYTRTLEKQAGFLPITDSELALSPNSRYLGSPDRLYTRYRFRYGNNISWGITAEKDAGEEFFKGSQPNGFDFYSGHFFLRNIGKIKSLAIGDYQVSFGQGLTFATGLAMGKTANTLAIKRNYQPLKPFTSVDENQFMRGAAATIAVGKFDVTAMFSSQRIDANVITTVDTTVTDEGAAVSSFQITGLHSTPAELADKDGLLSSHLGGHVAYKNQKLNIGVTAVYSSFDKTLDRSLSYYNQFEFTGNHNLVTGIDYNYIFRNLNFFGEVARSENGGWGTINGVIAALDPKLSFSVLYRNYGRNYQTLFANPLAEATNPTNEQGIYLGVELKPSPYWTINAYFDSFKSNWLKYGADAPTYGYELLSQVTWKPSKKLEMYARIRHRNKPSNTTEIVSGPEYTDDQLQSNYRYQVSYKVSESFTLKNRVELVDYKKGNEPTEKGYIIYQDVLYKPLSKPFDVTLRYALFDTDSYNSRMYAYENDVLYSYSIPSYYYRGSRFYGIVRYQYKKLFDVWIKYGCWLYNNRTVLGSGLNEIQGNGKSEIKIQLRFKF